jgi:YfiH family protein
VFYKDSENVYRVRPLDEFDWLEHGFGTRMSNNFGKCRNVATLRQIHSDSVIAAEGRSGSLGEGDALIENTPGALVAVKTADCIPLLIVDPRNRAVAAVHAGWRGTARNIGARAIAELHGKFSSRAEDLHVAIGPGIGKCCYEVGPDVGMQFREYDETLRDITHPVHVDLAEINRQQIMGTGVPSRQIYIAGLCTMCRAEFHSYRRDKQDAGRMLSVVGVK